MNRTMVKHTIRFVSACTILLLQPGCEANKDEPRPATQVDILISNGSVFGGGKSDSLALLDVGIVDGKITFIGHADDEGVVSSRVLDATGLIVAPGFVDPHTHSLAELLSVDKNSNINYVMQGVTTVFNGNDGGDPVLVAETMQRLEVNGIGTNAALFVGHGGVRFEVMGGENREPTADELTQMSALVRGAMQSGALGLSTGLYYVPGHFADTDEVIALAKIAAEYGGVYDTHLRDESTYNIGFLASVEETLKIGREANIPVHISHIKALGVDVWGQSSAAIAMIESARAAGQPVTANQYPWRASGTHLRNAVLPQEAMSGASEEYLQRLKDAQNVAAMRPAIAENIRRRGGPESLLVVIANDPEIVGLTLAEIAAERKQHPIDTAVEIMLAGSTRIASFNMSQDDINAFMKMSWVMTSSDGTDGHPRKYASFPKKYRDYVVEQGIISIEDFLYRSSGLTAETFGLAGRGRIEKDYVADIVVFDPDEFGPAADFKSWNKLSVGLVHSIINGQLIVTDREYTGSLPGLVLRRN